MLLINVVMRQKIQMWQKVILLLSSTGHTVVREGKVQPSGGYKAVSKHGGAAWHGLISGKQKGLLALQKKPTVALHIYAHISYSHFGSLWDKLSPGRNFCSPSSKKCVFIVFPQFINWAPLCRMTHVQSLTLKAVCTFITRSVHLS